LVPLQTEQGGRCVLATGDRPTVIYLTGGAGGGAVNFSNPKLCYSNVNLSASDTGEDDDVNRPPAQQSIAINVATPFVSPQLFDTSSVGGKHFSLCVSDDSHLRLGIIDDIQKLHVTTCRLGMAPRRVVHCSEDRMFAVGCIESGLKQDGSTRDDVNMGNCIRFLDDTTFDDIER
jgi:DNA damage-binding protein 1